MQTLITVNYVSFTSPCVPLSLSSPLPPFSSLVIPAVELVLPLNFLVLLVHFHHLCPNRSPLAREERLKLKL